MRQTGRTVRILSLVTAVLMLFPEALPAAPIRPQPSSFQDVINRQKDIRVQLRDQFIVLTAPVTDGDTLGFKSSTLEDGSGKPLSRSGYAVPSPIRLGEVSQVQVRRGMNGTGMVVGAVAGMLVGLVIGGAIGANSHTHRATDDPWQQMGDSLDEMDKTTQGAAIGMLAGGVVFGFLGALVGHRQWKTLPAAPDSPNH